MVEYISIVPKFCENNGGLRFCALKALKAYLDTKRGAIKRVFASTHFLLNVQREKEALLNLGRSRMCTIENRSAINIQLK